jgi:23S rRNA pseudouridine2605 synthase
MRINRYLAKYGGVSRRKADELIVAGRVKLNGKTFLKLGEEVKVGEDVVEIDGHKIFYSKDEFVYILLYKPRGVVSTSLDTHGRKTVMDLVKIESRRLYPVGRLDYDSEGLMLLTNDGDLAHGMMHPRFHLPKRYLVWVEGEVNGSKMAQLNRGIQLEEGLARAEVSTVQKQSVPGTKRWPHPDAATKLVFVLYTGWKRQIRRMCEAVGLRVERLQRVRIGSVGDDYLKPGTWRFLTENEVGELKEGVGESKKE